MKFLFTISVVSSKLVDEKKENHQLRVSFPLFVLRASRVGEHANARENYRTGEDATREKAEFARVRNLVHLTNRTAVYCCQP